MSFYITLPKDRPRLNYNGEPVKGPTGPVEMLSTVDFLRGRSRGGRFSISADGVMACIEILEAINEAIASDRIVKLSDSVYETLLEETNDPTAVIQGQHIKVGYDPGYISQLKPDIVAGRDAKREDPRKSD